jgi:hypothetical protein
MFLIYSTKCKKKASIFIICCDFFVTNTNYICENTEKVLRDTIMYMFIMLKDAILLFVRPLLIKVAGSATAYITLNFT